MDFKNSVLVRVISILVIYFVLKYLGGSFGQTVLYPVSRLVTFLHELGHGIGALITGGSVLAIQINEDGSGFTKTMGGSRGIILMGGYIGSALMGNLLFYIGARKPKMAEFTLYGLAIAMIFTGIYWFNSMYTTGFLILFGLGLFLIANKTNFDREVLMFLGIACILYIIQDFNVGPSSDLNEYAKIFVVIPSHVWMYIWLFIALFLTFLNLKMVFKERKP